jgi:hypothetical protein
MPPAASSCPLTPRAVVDLYFMEHRAKLLDIAAFLDRLDRATADPTGPTGPTGSKGRDDVRVRALRRALPLLLDGQPDRVRRILELLSDHTVEPISAAHTQSALGADPHGDY